METNRVADAGGTSPVTRLVGPTSSGRMNAHAFVDGYYCAARCGAMSPKEAMTFMDRQRSYAGYTMETVDVFLNGNDDGTARDTFRLRAIQRRLVGSAADAPK